MQRGLSATAELFFTFGSLTLMNKLHVLCKDLLLYRGLHLAFMLTFTADVFTVAIFSYLPRTFFTSRRFSLRTYFPSGHFYRGHFYRSRFYRERNLETSTQCTDWSQFALQHFKKICPSVKQWRHPKIHPDTPVCEKHQAAPHQTYAVTSSPNLSHRV